MQRVAAGEADAVAECIRGYGGLVWSIAKRYISDPIEIEDAVQEVFISLWQSAQRFDPAKAAESTFVAMIARRRLIDRVRRGSSRPDETPVELGEGGFDFADPTHGSERLEAGVDLKKAAAAVAELKPAEQQVIRLAIVEGRSHGEIAEATGMPLGTVKTNVRRGLQRVRDRLRAGVGAARA